MKKHEKFDEKKYKSFNDAIDKIVLLIGMLIVATIVIALFEYFS